MIDEIKRHQKTGDFSKDSEEVLAEVESGSFGGEMEGFDDQLPVEAEIDDHPAESECDGFLDVLIMKQHPERVIIDPAL